MGTDYPFDVGTHEPVQFVGGAKLTAAEKEATPAGRRRAC
jgi:hypothetical protein